MATAVKFILNARMPAVAALNADTRWIAKTTLCKDNEGATMVNLDATPLKAMCYQKLFTSFTPIRFTIATTKGRSSLSKCACVKGVAHESGCRRFVPIDTFVDVLGKESKVMHAAGLVPEFIAPTFVDTEPFYSYVLGITAVHYDAEGKGEHITYESLYCTESAVVATFNIDRDILRRRLVLTPFVNVRAKAGAVPERAYRFTDIRANVYRGKLNNEAIAAKFAEFDSLVFSTACDPPVDTRTVVVKLMPNSKPEVVRDGDIAELAEAFNFTYMPTTETEEVNIQREKKASRTRRHAKVVAERAFVSQLETITKPETLEEAKALMVTDDSATETDVDVDVEEVPRNEIVVASTFKKASYDPVLYHAPMGMFCEFSNAEGDAAHFVAECSGIQTPLTNAATLDSTGLLFRVGLSVNGPDSRLSTHIRTANEATGKVIQMRDHPNYKTIHVGHAALRDCGLDALESALHKALRGIDGVYQSNVNGFAIDVSKVCKDGSPVKSKELFLVAPGRALRQFQQVFIEFEDKCSTQPGILELIKKPEEALRHAISRNYINEFAAATESIVSRAATGVTGIVHDLGETQRSIIGFTATINNQFVEDRREHFRQYVSLAERYAADMKEAAAAKDAAVKEATAAKDAAVKEATAAKEAAVKEAAAAAKDMYPTLLADLAAKDAELRDVREKLSKMNDRLLDMVLSK